MNYFDALEITKQQCSNCDHFVKCEYCARTFIIDALEKQIPKKPVKAAFKSVKCPNCGNYYELDNYCPACGQLLEWEEA